jgi:Protein of unknown function (DUF1523).
MIIMLRENAMRYVKWTLIFLVALTAFAFLHYTLPQK